MPFPDKARSAIVNTGEIEWVGLEKGNYKSVLFVLANLSLFRDHNRLNVSNKFITVLS